VNTIEKRHRIAVRLLTKLDLSDVLLQPVGKSHYFWEAWSRPNVMSNGHETVRRGKLKIPA